MEDIIKNISNCTELVRSMDLNGRIFIPSDLEEKHDL